MKRIPLKPLFEEDTTPNFDALAGEAIQAAMSIGERSLTDLAWLPSPNSALSVLRFALGTAPLSTAFTELFGVSSLFNLRFFAAALALSQTSESERVDTTERKAWKQSLNCLSHDCRRSSLILMTRAA